MNYLILIIIFSLFSSYFFDCIPNENCLENRGECVGDTCICYEEYWTLKSLWKNNNKIFCNYDKESRIKPLVLEFFFPGIGHLIMKKYKLCIVKLILLFTPIILLLIGFYNFKNGSIKNNSTENKLKKEEELKLIIKKVNINNKENISDQQETKKEAYFSDEGKESSLNDSSEIHIPIHEETPIPFIKKFLTMVAGFCIFCFFIMHITDLIKYSFAFYTDDNDVPFL